MITENRRICFFLTFYKCLFSTSMYKHRRPDSCHINLGSLCPRRGNMFIASQHPLRAIRCLKNLRNRRNLWTTLTRLAERGDTELAADSGYILAVL